MKRILPSRWIPLCVLLTAPAHAALTVMGDEICPSNDYFRKCPRHVVREMYEAREIDTQNAATQGRIQNLEAQLRETQKRLTETQAASERMRGELQKYLELQVANTQRSLLKTANELDQRVLNEPAMELLREQLRAELQSDLSTKSGK